MNPCECLVLFVAICMGFKVVLMELTASAGAMTVFTKPRRLKPMQIAAIPAMIFVKTFVSTSIVGFFLI